MNEFRGLYSREGLGAQKARRSLKQKLIHTFEWELRCRDGGGRKCGGKVGIGTETALVSIDTVYGIRSLGGVGGINIDIKSGHLASRPGREASCEAGAWKEVRSTALPGQDSSGCGCLWRRKPFPRRNFKPDPDPDTDPDPDPAAASPRPN